MSTSNEKCLIWGNGHKATVHWDGFNRFVGDSARAGGSYEITREAELSLGELGTKQKALLTTWLVDQREQGNQYPLITGDIVRHITFRPNLPVHERADRLLLFIDESAQTVADYVQISPEDCDAACAWSESLNWREVFYFLGELKNKGWIQAGTFAENMFKGWVTIDGHNRIAEVRASVHSSQVSVLQDSLTAVDRASSNLTTETGSTKVYTYDFFICHASEDKDGLVRKLADSLQFKGAIVWYDEFTLRVGSRLRRNIEHGLATSRFGIVIVSPSFFGKEWPQNELDGLFALASQDSERILPIWHDVTRDEVANKSPMLADILALNTSLKSIDEISLELMKRL